MVGTWEGLTFRTWCREVLLGLAVVGIIMVKIVVVAVFNHFSWTAPRLEFMATALGVFPALRFFGRSLFQGYGFLYKLTRVIYLFTYSYGLEPHIVELTFTLIAVLARGIAIAAAPASPLLALLADVVGAFFWLSAGAVASKSQLILHTTALLCYFGGVARRRGDSLFTRTADAQFGELDLKTSVDIGM